MKPTEPHDPWIVRSVRTVWNVSGDFVAVIGIVALSNVTTVVGFAGTVGSVLRAVSGFLLLFFLPGYALLTVLFPEQPESRSSPFGPRTALFEDRGIDGTERTALSFGISLALLPFMGLALSLAGAAVDPVMVVLSVSTIVLVGMALGTVRRMRLPESKQFRIPVRTWGNDLFDALFGSGVGRGALTALLIASIVTAAGGLVYAASTPGVDESYTTLALLSDDDSGERVASAYPTEFTVGETQEITVSVENHEQRGVEYTVVAQLQRVETDDSEVLVVESRELDRTSFRVADGRTHNWTHKVSPTLEGGRLRLTYLLYRGGVPADPSTESAYEHAYVWVNVSQEL